MDEDVANFDIGSNWENDWQVSRGTFYESGLMTARLAEALLGKGLQDKKIGLWDICLVVKWGSEMKST